MQQVVVVHQQAATIVVKPPFNHGLHALITLLTCGMWLPVWIIRAILH